jgi:hypothetical protein
MQRCFGAFFLFAFVAMPMQSADAGSLPEIKSNPKNPVPACATPGRMMEYLKSRNPELNSRYEGVATEYMRVGEALGVRWDYAFYQMIIETGSLSYRRGNRAGDVKPTQNNFAGLGATGGGEPGDSFSDIATGVRGHLEHLLLYSGAKLDNPVAERTRKVQEWGVLTPWQAKFTRPITFADMAAKWAPGSGTYSKMLEAIAEKFDEDFCSKPDPRPELVATARGQKAGAQEVKTAEVKPVEKPSGTVLAQRAIDESKSRNGQPRFGLGAQSADKPAVPFKILNAPPIAEPDRPLADTSQIETAAAKAKEPEAKAPEFKAAESKTKDAAKPKTATAATTPGARSAAPADKGQVRVASAAGSAKQMVEPAPAGQKCRVWTASYGGQKAMIIRSLVDKVVNYTVLDVNEGAESREAEAFIAAYAKDGKITGEFVSQTQALDKAFELCPEG